MPPDELNEQPLPENEGHNQAFEELGAEAALDVPDVPPPSFDPPVAPAMEVPPLDVGAPEADMPLTPAPISDVLALTADHDVALKDLGAIAAEGKATPQAQVRKRAEKRAEQRRERLGIQPKAPPQAQHNQAFIELNNIVREEPGEHADAPVAVELPPEEAKKSGEAGGDGAKGAVAGAIVDFAKEDKAWRAEVKTLFQIMAREIGQQRKELDEIRGFLERTRE